MNDFKYNSFPSFEFTFLVWLLVVVIVVYNIMWTVRLELFVEIDGILICVVDGIIICRIHSIVGASHVFIAWRAHASGLGREFHRLVLLFVRGLPSWFVAGSPLTQWRRQYKHRSRTRYGNGCRQASIADAWQRMCTKDPPKYSKTSIDPTAIEQCPTKNS